MKDAEKIKMTIYLFPELRLACDKARHAYMYTSYNKVLSLNLLVMKCIYNRIDNIQHDIPDKHDVPEMTILGRQPILPRKKVHVSIRIPERHDGIIRGVAEDRKIHYTDVVSGIVEDVLRKAGWYEER